MSEMIRKLALAALFSIFCAPALASDQSTVVSSNNAQNTQSNSGTVNLAPMGGSNSNYQINSVSNSQHSFGPGISCPTPEIGVGAFGGNNNSYGGGYSNGANNYGATVMFTTPLGGEVSRACRELASEITRQRQLDTDLTMIQKCANLATSGITIDTRRFPEFEVCSAVSVNGRTAVQ